MYSFIRKFMPCRKESMRIQNKKSTLENNTDPTVTTSDETGTLEKRDSETQSEMNKSEQNEEKDSKAINEKDSKHVESIRKGINNLLKEFKKENITVATLMDQDGRIFFSIDMTVIINQDEKLNSIVKAVQKSMEESSNRILVDQNLDEVTKKLRRHFLFESNGDVNVEEIPKLESGDKIETEQIHAKIKTSHSMERQNTSEETLLNNEVSREKLISISADETELTSLFYSYVKKLDKKRIPISNIPVIIKREKGEKNGTETHTETKPKKTRNRAIEPDHKVDHKVEKKVGSDSKEKRYYKRKHFAECTSSREDKGQKETKRNRYKKESLEYIKRKIRKKIRKRSKKPESKKRKESANRSRRRHRSKRKVSPKNPSIENFEEHKTVERKEYKERQEKQDKTKVLETVDIENKIFSAVVEKESSKHIQDFSVTRDSKSKIEDNVLIQNDEKKELRDNTDLKHKCGDSGDPRKQSARPTRQTKSHEIRTLLQKMIEQCPHLADIEAGGSSEEVIAVTSFEHSS